MARKPFVGGNWKMNLHTTEAVDLPLQCQEVAAVGAAIKGSGIKLGAQDVYHEGNGAFTGEVSTSMLKDVGVEVVLTGHSERRHVIGESDVLINAKTRAALKAGFEVILCIGEKIEQR